MSGRHIYTYHSGNEEALELSDGHGFRGGLDLARRVFVQKGQVKPRNNRGRDPRKSREGGTQR